MAVSAAPNMCSVLSGVTRGIKCFLDTVTLGSPDFDPPFVTGPEQLLGLAGGGGPVVVDGSVPGLVIPEGVSVSLLNLLVIVFVFFEECIKTFNIVPH